MSAMLDALAVGVPEIDMPATPSKLWQAIAQARRPGAGGALAEEWRAMAEHV